MLRSLTGWCRSWWNCAHRGGRLFIMGSGGGAGHASHAVNDFRKIAGIEAYSPTDNVSELTARVNDDGWETQLCQLAQGQPLKQPRYAPDLFGGGRQSGTSGQHEPGAVPGIAQEVGACQLRHGGPGWRATPHRWPTLASSCPRSIPARSPPTWNPFKRWSGTSSFLIPTSRPPP